MKKPPLSIILFTSLLCLMQLAALGIAFTQGRLNAAMLVNLAILMACAGLWALRKWAAWLMLGALTALALSKILPEPEPLRYFLKTGLPFILFASACTLPHYSKMR